MAKILKCGDLMPGCNFVAEGKDVAEVMAKGARSPAASAPRSRRAEHVRQQVNEHRLWRRTATGYNAIAIPVAAGVLSPVGSDISAAPAAGESTTPTGGDRRDQRAAALARAVRAGRRRVRHGRGGECRGGAGCAWPEERRHDDTGEG